MINFLSVENDLIWALSSYNDGGIGQYFVFGVMDIGQSQCRQWQAGRGRLSEEISLNLQLVPEN
ncbi:hypothetical protein [Burkholderia sp. Bp8992]|uniref:hypothetical protein n=1 Tax=Burkholderia sp. Bp8992 TaxID=2184554 RepID=UPI000F560178|nr:hypothetical protein [Burkholderia sp. Bp8992]